MRSKVCPECRVAILRPHHELVYWFKCPTCAYCEFNLDLLSKEDQEKAKKNKFASRTKALDEKVWKPWLTEEEDR